MKLIFLIAIALCFVPLVSALTISHGVQFYPILSNVNFDLNDNLSNNSYIVSDNLRLTDYLFVIDDTLSYYVSGNHSVNATIRDFTIPYDIVSELGERTPWQELGIQYINSTEDQFYIVDGGYDSSYTGKYQVGFYDVIVNIRDDLVDTTARIDFDIIINNTGDLADQDTILTYWFEDPLGKTIDGSREQILEVPQGKHIFSRDMRLPSNSSVGYWKVYVSYDTVIQPKITVYDSFEVYEQKFFAKVKDKIQGFIYKVKSYITNPKSRPVLFAIFILILIATMFWLYKTQRGKDEN